MLASSSVAGVGPTRHYNKEERGRGPICASGEEYQDGSNYTFTLFMFLWGRASIINSNFALFTVPELSGHYRSHQTAEELTVKTVLNMARYYSLILD